MVILFSVGVFFSTSFVRADDSSTLWQKANKYLELGRIEAARELLLDLLSTTSDPKSITRAQGMLGNADFLEGKYREALDRYQVVFDRSTGSTKLVAANNLASSSRKLEEKYDRDLALVKEEGDLKLTGELKGKLSEQQSRTQFYRQQALNLTDERTDEVRIRALLNGNKVEEAALLVAKLPDSRIKVDFLVEMGDLPSLIKARSLADSERNRSFIALLLGQSFKAKGDLSQAELYTDEAISLAQSIFAEDLLYQQWYLLGNIYYEQGKESEAISAWRNSIASMQKIRGDLAVASRRSRLDFNEEIEPIYKQLIKAYFDRGELQEVQNIGDLRQLSELEAFFGDICLQLSPASSRPLQNNGIGIISTFVFDDSVGVLLQLPDGSYRSHRIDIPKEDFLTAVKTYRQSLENVFSDDYLQVSQRLYDLLLRPLEASLAKVDRLVFVNEGILRNVPMAALHDGERYLIERYPISYTLSPNLVAPVVNSSGESLIFGLSVSVGNWLPLTEVIREAEQVKSIIGGESILNEEFTGDGFKQAIVREQPSKIHIATHGKFVGTLERSYLQAFDRPIDLTELESSLSGSNIDLLVLSACQTAEGNDKSILGMAGVALRSGISTVVGSLWSIPDTDGANLMESFYTYLASGLKPAEALRAAQLELIKIDNEHPSIWSSFIVLGNEL